MKKTKNTYDLEEIYKKLISDEIPQSYVDFVVSRCSNRFMTEAEEKRQQNVTFATVYPKLYNKM